MGNPKYPAIAHKFSYDMDVPFCDETLDDPCINPHTFVELLSLDHTANDDLTTSLPKHSKHKQVFARGILYGLGLVLVCLLEAHLYKNISKISYLNTMAVKLGSLLSASLTLLMSLGMVLEESNSLSPSRDRLNFLLGSGLIVGVCFLQAFCYNFRNYLGTVAGVTLTELFYVEG